MNVTFRFYALPLMLAALTGCATQGKPPPVISLDESVQAQPLPEPPAPVEVVAVPEVLPMPAQLKPMPEAEDAKPTPEPADEKLRVSRANAEARIAPTREGYVNAIQVWPFTDGALYQVYAAVGRVTVIALQPGELKKCLPKIEQKWRKRRLARERTGQAHSLGPQDESGHHHQPQDVPAGADLDREDVDGVGVLGLSERPDAGLAAPGAGGQRRRAGRYRAVAGEPALPVRDQRQHAAVEAAARLR
mgnify:CR=1 FL=1